MSEITSVRIRVQDSLADQSAFQIGTRYHTRGRAADVHSGRKRPRQLYHLLEPRGAFRTARAIMKHDLSGSTTG